MSSRGAVTEETQEVEVDKQEKEATPLQSIFLSLSCFVAWASFTSLHHTLVYFFCIFAFDYLDVADLFAVDLRINAMQMSFFVIFLRCF